MTETMPDSVAYLLFHLSFSDCCNNCGCLFFFPCSFARDTPLFTRVLGWCTEVLLSRGNRGQRLVHGCSPDADYHRQEQSYEEIS